MQRLVYRSAFRRPPKKKPTCERASALEVDKTLFLKLTGRIPQYPTMATPSRTPAAIAPVKAGSMTPFGNCNLHHVIFLLARYDHGASVSFLT